MNAQHQPMNIFPYPVGVHAPLMNLQRNPFNIHPQLPLHLHTGVPLMQVAAPTSVSQGPPPPPPPPPPSQQVSYIASQPDGKQLQVCFQQLKFNQHSHCKHLAVRDRCSRKGFLAGYPYTVTCLVRFMVNLHNPLFTVLPQTSHSQMRKWTECIVSNLSYIEAVADTQTGFLVRLKGPNYAPN